MSVIKDYSPRLGVSYSPTPTGNVADLERGSNGQLLIGQTAASTAYKSVTGDVTIDKDGVTTLGAGKVLETMLSLSSAVGLGVIRVAHMKYSFAVDGGTAGEIIPATSPIIPANSIVFGGFANVTTALLASGGAANIAIGTHAGSATDALKAATAKATYALNSILALTPVFTAGSAFKMSVAGQMSITVDTHNLTAGVMEVFAAYVVASA